MSSQRANFPITGPRAGSHEDAKTLTRAAQQALDDVKRLKAAAATRNPEKDRFAENARGPKVGPNAFDKIAGPRTT